MVKLVSSLYIFGAKNNYSYFRRVRPYGFRQKLNYENLFFKSKIAIHIFKICNFDDVITLLQNHGHHQIQNRMSMLRLTVRLSMAVDLK